MGKNIFRMKCNDFLFFCLFLLNANECKSQTFQNESISSLQKQFTSSELPHDYRPTMRYWWLGGAITEKQLRREMSEIYAK